MPTYTIDAPNGKRYSIEGPPGATRDEVIAEIMRRDPSAGTPPSKARTWGESVKDVGAGLVSGVGSLAALPGQLYGLATGDMDNVSTRAGRELKESAESMKSAGLKAREAERRRKIDAAEEKGQIAAGVTALKETISDPGLLLNFVAEQLPNLIPGLAAAKGVSLATKGAASLGAKTAAAVGAGAAQQGADVGAGAYDRLVQELVAKGASKEEAAQGAINLARATGASAAIISVLANRYLPGGTALEKVLAGGKTGRGVITGGVSGAIKEIPSENVEEVGGQLSSNIAMRQIKPEQSLVEGLGETAGMATVGAIGMGGVTGAVGGRGAPPAENTPAGENLELLKMLKAEEDARVEAKAQREQETQAQREREEQAIADKAERAARVETADRTELSRMLAGLSKKDPLHKQITARIQAIDAGEVESLRATKQRDAEDAKKAAQSVFADPQAQMGMREAAVAGDTQLPVEEAAQEEAPATSAAQRPLPFDVPEPKLRRKGEGKQLPPEPPAPPPMGPIDPNKPLSMDDLRGLIPQRGQVANWFKNNVVGKTLPEVAAIVAAKPGMVKGSTAIAKALRELTSVSAAPYEAPVTDLQPEPAADGQSAESGVGAPAHADAGPTEAPTDTEGAVAPDGAGVGGVPASAGTESMVESPPAPPLDPIEAVESAKSDEEYQQALEHLAAAFSTPSEDTRVADYVEENFGDAAFKRDFQAAEARLRARRRTRPESAPTVQEVTVPGLVEAVTEGDTLRALKLVEQSEQSTPAQREVAKRLQRYRSQPKMKLVPDLPSDGVYDAVTDTVELKTITPHTVLHEVVHAGVHRIVAAADSGKVQNAGVQKLRAVYEHVYRVRPDLRDTYGMSDISEFASESMSNSDFQNELRKIPYQRTNAFTAFARAVAQMFGFAGTSENTAAAEAIIAVDQIMSTGGREYQESKTGQGTLDGEILDAQRRPLRDRERASVFSDIVQSSDLMKEQPGAVQQAYASALRVLDKSTGLTPATRFRVYTTDNMAAVARVFDSVWGGKVRSSLGQLNPMVAARSTQDFSKKLEAIYVEGGLEFDRTSGDFVAMRVPGVPSMTDIWDAVRAWGDSKGMAFDEAYASVSKMLEAVRLNELKALKAAGQIDVPIHALSQSDPRDADTQIAEALTELQRNPDVSRIKDMLDKSREHYIDFMVNQGRISAEDAADWKAASGYVSFNRVNDPNTQLARAFKPSTTGARGLAKYRNLPDLVGSETREVANVIDNHLQLISYMATEGAKARTTRNMLYTMRSLGMATLLKGKPAPTRTMVKAYENGKEVWFDTRDPLYALAFSDAPVFQNSFIRLLQNTAQILRSTITLMPPFIASQVVQDIQRAMIASGVQNPWALPKRIVSNFFKFAWTDITGKRHPDVERMAQRGIAGGYDIDLQNPALSAMQELGYRKRRVLPRIARLADGLLRSSDLAVRAAIYDQTIKESQDATLALQRAREIINFRRRGASQTVSFLVATVPFVNAYMQSMDLLYRNAVGTDNSMGINRNEARSRLVQQLAAVAAFSMIYALMMQDEEEYNEMDLRERHRHYLIPGLNVKIPVPPEWAAVAKVPAEMFVEYMRKEGTPEELYAMEALKAVLGSLLEATAGPLPIPSALKPVLEAMANYSTFTSTNIEGTYQRTLDPSQRTNYRTSELSIAIAKAAAELGFDVISPIMLDHLIVGYTATTGSTLLAMTDAMLNPDRMDRPIYKTFMASTFIYDEIGARADREFYDFAEKVMPKARTLNDLLTRDPERAEAYAERYAADLEAAEAVGAAIQELGELRKIEKYLRSNQAAADGMSQEERREALDNLRRERSEYLSFVREVKKEYYAMKSATP